MGSSTLSRTLRCRDSRRTGITLVEVMFSMGVGFIGLLGVAALIPLTASQLGKATRADISAAFGVAAIDDLQARGYARPTAWAIWNVNTSQYEPLLAFDYTTNQYNINTAVGWMPGDSFCLDPNMLSRQNNTVAPTVRFFPSLGGSAPSSTDPVMWRVTLLDVPGLNSGATNINGAYADEIFMLGDDLVFARPTDATLPPLQQFSPMGTSGPAKRQFAARLSFMATFSPFIDVTDAVRPNGFPNRGAFSQQNAYTMSLVVFDRRNMDPTSESDRRVPVVAFPGLGIGGGDIVIAGATEDAVEVRSGDWIMLGTRIQTGPTPSVFRWYRVLSADREAIFDSSQNVFRREVYLEGADWPFADTSTFATQATILSGIAAVFEKTIRLEGLSP